MRSFRTHVLAVLLGLALVATTAATTASAQEAEPAAESEDRTAHNALYVELLGNAIFYSLNYERFIIDSVAARIGLGYFSVSVSTGDESASATVLTAPLMVNYLGIGGASHKLELGVGVLIVYASGSVDTLAAESEGSGVGFVGSGSIAYRYVPYDGGFNFKIGLAPLFGGFGFLPWPALALGAAF
jgi:hypothetical protein